MGSALSGRRHSARPGRQPAPGACERRAAWHGPPV